MSRRMHAVAFGIATVISPVASSGQTAPAPPRPSVGVLTPAPAVVSETSILANGVRLVTVAHGETPKALIQVVVETGAERPDECRLTRVLADLFRSGTASLNGERLTDSITHMGGTLAVSARPEGIDLTLEVLSPYAEPAIELLGQIVHVPRVDSGTVATAVAAAMVHGPGGRSDVSATAQETFRGVLFPGGEFGRACAQDQAYTQAAIRHFHAGRVTGGSTTVYVVGRFSRPAAERAVSRAFGTLVRGGGDAPRAEAGGAPAAGLEIVQQPGARQVALVVGERVPGPSDSDFTRLRVANALLGGSLISRITMNIREAHGYAYAPASELVATPSGGAYWAEQVNVAAPVAWPALREIIKEVGRLGMEAPDSAELAGTQRYVIGRTLVTRATRAGVLDALETAEPSAGHPGGVLGVRPGDVQRVTGSYIGARDLTIVVAGDTTAMGGQIADLRRGVAALRAGQADGAR